MGTGNQGEDFRLATENVGPTGGLLAEKSSSGNKNVNIYIQKNSLWVLGNICRQFGE